MSKTTRERFNTTLSPEHRRKLMVLAANNGLKKENYMVEKLIDQEWERGNYDEMENKSRNK